MIYSEQEYQTTLKAAARFEEALAKFDQEPEPSDPLMRELVRASLETELELLRQQLAQFRTEHLRISSSDVSDTPQLNASPHFSYYISSKEAIILPKDLLLPESDSDVLKLSEVARLISINSTTLLRWCKTGVIPAVKVGKSYRILRKDFEEWQRRFHARGST